MRRSVPGRFLRGFLHDADGATAIEYGLIVCLISLVVIGAVTTTGSSLWTTLNKVSNALGH